MVRRIVFRCSACAENLAVAEEGMGKILPCAVCGSPVTVPTPSVAVRCPLCRAVLLASESLAEEVVECPDCGSAVEIPVLVEGTDQGASSVKGRFAAQHTIGCFVSRRQFARHWKDHYRERDLRQKSNAPRIRVVLLLLLLCGVVAAATWIRHRTTGTLTQERRPDGTLVDGHTASQAAESPVESVRESPSPLSALPHGSPVTANLPAKSGTVTSSSAVGRSLLFPSVQGSLVVIEGKRSAGSGFVVMMEGKKYILTNQHVLDGIQQAKFVTVDKKVLRPRSVELARTVDLARAPVTDYSIPALRMASTAPTIGEPVYVCGNSLGAGAVTELKGEVVGLGPVEIEINATFVQGNSGSPILNADGDVVGVATYATARIPRPDWLTLDSRFWQVRRFGVRTPADCEWIRVTWQDMGRLSAILRDTDLYLVEVMTIMGCWIEGHWQTECVRCFQKRLSKPQTRHYRKTSQETAVEKFCRQYKRHWDSKGNFSVNSSSVLAGEKAAAAVLIRLPTVPRSRLTLNRWPSQHFEEKVEKRLEVIRILEEECTKITKSHAWKENVLTKTFRRSYPYAY